MQTSRLLWEGALARLKRSGDEPDLDGEASDRGHPSRLRTELDSSGYKVVFRRDRWRVFYEEDEDEFGPYRMRTRKTVAWARLNGQRVAGVELAEYDIDLFDNSTIWTMMDGESADMARIAEILLSHWEDFSNEVTPFGPVVEIRMVWAHPDHARHQLWMPILRELLRRVKWSIAIALAYPTEYSGKLPKGSRHHHAFRRRRAAMRRHYGRRLGAISFPARAGKDGWLWIRHPRLKETYFVPPEYDGERLRRL